MDALPCEVLMVYLGASKQWPLVVSASVSRGEKLECRMWAIITELRMVYLVWYDGLEAVKRRCPSLWTFCPGIRRVRRAGTLLSTRE